LSQTLRYEWVEDPEERRACLPQSSIRGSTSGHACPPWQGIPVAKIVENCGVWANEVGGQSGTNYETGLSGSAREAIRRG
jgi:hypothetical protein